MVILAARCATVQEPGLPTRSSFGWPYGGQQNACIFSSNILEAVLCSSCLVQVVSWYDNEWGYSNRVVDLAAFLAKKDAKVAA